MTRSTLTLHTLESPYGTLMLVGSPDGLRAVLWPDDEPARVGLVNVNLGHGSSGVLDEVAGQLEEYFAHVRTSFDLPLDLHGTRFQVAAWEALAAIPYGETRTYAVQAARVGRPNAARAIGAANGRNPISIVLPCHRVVGSDGTLTGFAGGIEVKAALLAFEHAHCSRARA